MQVPFVYVSPRVYVQQPVSFNNERGVSYQLTEGEHGIWAARVPFLPSMLSDDFVRMGKQRIELVAHRQYRFIYDLARARENSSTFELRFVATPNPVPGQPNLIDIVFLGKTFSTLRGRAEVLAVRLWDKFVANFPLEDPFNYPLLPVTDEAEFWRCYEPLPFRDLTAASILEIRKYEDLPIRSMAPLGRVERKGDYIAHPFVPNMDFSPMGQFLASLAGQPERCYAGISLRPTRMFDQEIYNVSFAIGQFQKTASEDNDVTEQYIRSRSQIGSYVYQRLMLEREQLVMVRVHVVSDSRTPYGLAEALGSEMMGNADNRYPTQWVAVQPADGKELATALNNIQYLEHADWGHSIASAPLERLRYFCTAQEAYGAFRLPVPPESGYMPGVLVKSEPFVAPADELELRQQAIANLNDANSSSALNQAASRVELGSVYHRGNPTAQTFSVNVRDLTRHMLVAGSTGSGKSTTVKHLLAQLWSKYRIPFLVLYPVDKPDYRDLRGFPGLSRELLVFTLGDESTSPFRFNPFEVPEGLLLKTHMSRLMRVFLAAFSLQDPLPMIYREALRKVYHDRGWDTVLDRAKPGRHYPLMSDFYHAIDEITEGLNYGRETQDNVRQASVIRIGDLLENAGYVVNVQEEMSLDVILNKPTVMEIGRVGSPQDTALLMGFLLMRFAEEVERKPRLPDHPHITVVEEAHRLMAEGGTSLAGNGDTRAAAGEDFANILAEVRGYGEGIIIAEQMPTLLVKGAIGNTYIKLMHWLEDAPSFSLFSSIMNLNSQQQEYARTLTPGFAVARSPYGRPVHIKVPEFGDQEGYRRPTEDEMSDDFTRRHMAETRQTLGIADVPVTPWQAGVQARKVQRPTATVDAAAVARSVGKTILRAPMQTCAFCRPMLAEHRCAYRRAVSRCLQSPGLAHIGSALREAVAIPDAQLRWETITPLLRAVEATAGGIGTPAGQDAAYCYSAHIVERALGDNPREPGMKVVRDGLRTMLTEFHEHYGR